MKCTRCKENLVEGKNIYKNWHLPICINCRKNINPFGLCGNSQLTKEEEMIMYKRLKEDKER
jgi:hypothetical protein